MNVGWTSPHHVDYPLRIIITLLRCESVWGRITWLIRLVYLISCSDLQHRRGCFWVNGTAIACSVREKRGGWQWTLGKASMRNCTGPEPWSTGGIWISKGETFAKILRFQQNVTCSWKERYGDRPCWGRRVSHGSWNRSMTMVQSVRTEEYRLDDFQSAKLLFEQRMDLLKAVLNKPDGNM